MAHISIDDHQILITFPGWESLMTRRGTITVPRASLRSVQVQSDWSSEALGVRSGLVISGYRKVGTFKHPSGCRRLISMKRGLPLLRLGLDRAGTGFDEILLSTLDAEDIADALRTPARS